MAKSNRRRKLDRAKRETRASQQRATAGRRRAATEWINAMVDQLGKICDPATDASELPGLIEDHYHGGPAAIWLVPMMLKSASTPERLAVVANAMLAAPPCDSESDAGVDVDAGPRADAQAGPRPSVTGLSFAAAVAQARGDAAGFHRLIHQALAVTSDPEHRVRLSQHLHRAGRIAEAIELFEAVLRADPSDGLAAECYGDAIEEVFARARETPPTDDEDCPCGLGASWSQCCQPTERAALDRFTGNSGLVAMREAVAAWLPTSGYGQAVDAKALPPDGAFGLQAADRAGLAALLAEHALLTAHASGEEHKPDADDPDADTPLAAFAAAPTTPAELASRATTWREHARYGLWQIADPRPAPGLWCTEIVSGLTRYVQFPAEVAEDLPRWAVWLGAMVPVDGIWRCTGTGMRLSPAEADAVAQLVGDATTTIVEQLTGSDAGSPQTRSAREPMPIGEAEPHGVLAGRTQPASPQVAGLYGMVTGELLPRIAAEVYAYRSAQPVLRNADGDPACLVTAKIAVSDGPQVAGRLAGRSGFEADSDDPASVTWYGLRIPDEEAEALLVEAMTRLRAQGHPEAELHAQDGPQRWVRGTLRIVGDQIIADVNSVRRLDRLIDVLEGIGANPSVVAEKRIDLTPELSWSGDEHAASRGAATTAESWEEAWLDEPTSALRGHSPRQAAQGSQQPRLEALLRQSEYEGDLLAAEGKQGIDTAWLRHELGLHSYDQDPG